MLKRPQNPDQAIGSQSSLSVPAASRPELPSVPAHEETAEHPMQKCQFWCRPIQKRSRWQEAPSGSSDYGPVRRRRLPSKSGPMTLFRPTAMRQEDFVEVMQEVVSPFD